VGSSEPQLGPRRFELWRCGDCGTAVTAGEPVDLHDSGAFRPGAPRLHGLAAPLLRTFDAQRLALLGQVVRVGGPGVPGPGVPRARVLDVGAGQGRFVAAARAAGYDALGVEPSQRGIDRAAALGVSLIRAGVDDAAIPAGSLDTVVLWHVLEHLERPGDALERIAEWLTPGGGLLLGVPNLDSWQARLSGDRWYHLDVPRHRTHFTASGASALLARSGFEIVAVHHRLLEHNPFGMWQSVVNRATAHPSYLYNLLKRNAPLRSWDLAITVGALGLAPAAVLAELIAGFARHGGTIAILARRR
jgi:SAM-dependent methyltransferase